MVVGSGVEERSQEGVDFGKIRRAFARLVEVHWWYSSSIGWVITPTRADDLVEIMLRLSQLLLMSIL